MGTARCRRGVIAVVVTSVVVSACADSRDAQPDDTIPLITAASTSTTVPPPTTLGPPTTPAAPTTAAPAPSPATQPTVSQTAPPTAPPVGPPTVPTVPPTAPPTAPPVGPPTVPTAPPTVPTSPPVVTAGQPANCSADGIGADTGDLVISDVRCSAGWAVGLIDGCPAGIECESVDVFHVTEAGWQYDGSFPIVCPESLAGSGMSIHTALTFAPTPCQGDPGATEIIRPDSTGDRVTHLQIALVALGYDLAVDGRYGPRTQAAVRDVQARNGLEVDGIAGPRTQAALGIGPGAAQAVAPSSSPGPAPPAATGPVTPGEPVRCDAATIGADVGRTVAAISGCRGGWAIAPEQCPPGAIDCLLVDVFHITDEGWVYDGALSDFCVDDLTVTGMSVHTAAEFAELCADDLPQRVNVLPGTTGPEVEQVQIALVALGYPIAVDGTYGTRTEAAVRDFQAANDLEVDGIAGPATQSALGL